MLPREQVSGSASRTPRWGSNATPCQFAKSSRTAASTALSVAGSEAGDPARAHVAEIRMRAAKADRNCSMLRGMRRKAVDWWQGRDGSDHPVEELGWIRRESEQRRTSKAVTCALHRVCREGERSDFGVLFRVGCGFSISSRPREDAKNQFSGLVQQAAAEGRPGCRASGQAGRRCAGRRRTCEKSQRYMCLRNFSQVGVVSTCVLHLTLWCRTEFEETADLALI